MDSQYLKPQVEYPILELFYQVRAATGLKLYLAYVVDAEASLLELEIVPVEKQLQYKYRGGIKDTRMHAS
jgi:hypothetical protein